MTHNRYFVDVDGVIFTLCADGYSNYHGDFIVDEVECVVKALGDVDPLTPGSREILEEYCLWNSLKELASKIEDTWEDLS